MFAQLREYGLRYDRERQERRRRRETTRLTPAYAASGGAAAADPVAGAGQEMSERTVWVPDHKVSSCTQCQETFSFLNRKHHCRKCGGIFCGRCSQPRQIVQGERLCD